MSPLKKNLAKTERARRDALDIKTAILRLMTYEVKPDIPCESDIDPTLRIK